VVKVITFFLIGMLILALFGRLRLPGTGPRTRRAAKPKSCKTCGRFLIGNGPCDCGTKHPGQKG
jgi:hypothetical protein